MKVAHRPLVLEAEQITESMLAKVRNDYPQQIVVGDWLVTDTQGVRYVVEQESFDLLYERLEGTQDLLPSDDDLIAFLRERPKSSFAVICERFAVPYMYTPARPGPNKQTSGYSIEANKLSGQIQRLRRDGLIYNDGGWYAKDEQ
jgi:hypothetical protein